MSLTLIAAMTWPDRVLGRDGSIPWRLAADLKRFKEATLGHPVLMGRKTWESLPFKLPGRTNIVLSRRPLGAPGGRAEAPDALEDSLEAGLRRAALVPGGSEAFVIGGAQVYAEALPRADRLSLTLIHHAFDGDVRFPAWDPSDWTEGPRTAGRQDGEPPLAYEFLELKRTRPQGAA